MGDYLTHHATAAHMGSLVATFCVLLTLTGLAVMGAWLVYVDMRDHRLPGAVVRPMWVGTAVLLSAAAFLSGEPGRLFGMLCGSLGLWGLYRSLRAVSRGALGLGDVRLAGLLGTALGFFSLWIVVWAAVLGFVVGGLYALVLLMVRRVGLHDRVPFGPAMLTGTALVLIFG
ncbi:MAG: A24 family peptidase [Kocuria sp.]|nr:A24 family peptidase [Kocuria sp.]